MSVFGERGSGPRELRSNRSFSAVASPAYFVEGALFGARQAPIGLSRTMPTVMGATPTGGERGRSSAPLVGREEYLVTKNRANPSLSVETLEPVTGAGHQESQIVPTVWDKKPVKLVAGWPAHVALFGG
jgi:hypothetical protein